MHLHLSSFVCNAAQNTSWSGLSDRIYIRLGGYLRLVFSGSDSYSIRNNAWSDHWPGVNSPLKFSSLIFWVILQNRSNWAPCYIWEAYSNSIIKWYCLHVLSGISCHSKHWLRAGMHRIEWIMRVCLLCSFCWCGLRFHTDQTQESVLSFAVCAADMMNVSICLDSSYAGLDTGPVWLTDERFHFPLCRSLACSRYLLGNYALLVKKMSLDLNKYLGLNLRIMYLNCM